jgi:hypothetical protein
VAAEQPAAEEAAVAATTAGVARTPGRPTTTRRLGGTPTNGLATAAAKHASEHLERAGFRRSTNEHCAGANHRKDDSTTHEERSFKKRGIETLTRHVNMGRARPLVGDGHQLAPGSLQFRSFSLP